MNLSCHIKLFNIIFLSIGLELLVWKGITSVLPLKLYINIFYYIFYQCKKFSLGVLW